MVNISEFKFINDIFTSNVEGIEIPSHLWRGFLIPASGKLISGNNSERIGIRNKPGKGEVVWIPSLLGLGSRIEHDYSGLISLLEMETKTSLGNLPVRFSQQKKNMLMKTLRSGDFFITIVINKNELPQEVKLNFKKKDLKPTIVFSNSKKKIEENSFLVIPEETVVIKWEM